MLSRVIGSEVCALLVAISCSSSEESGNGEAGAGPEGGESAGREPTGGTKGSGGVPLPIAGKAGGDGGPGGAAGAPPGAIAGAGAGGEAAGTGGTAGAVASEGGGGASEGGGGADEGGAPGCIADVGVMPPSPLAPSAAECASGCSVPPFDGVTLPTGCGDASNVPPAAAVGVPDGVPPGGIIVVNGQPTSNGSPMTGGPCDVGWCPTFVPKVLTIGMSTSYNWEQAVIKAGVGEVAHLAREQHLISFDYAAIGPTGFIGNIGGVDLEHYSNYITPPGQPPGWAPWGDPRWPAIGVDTRPGQNRVYVAYAGVWGRGKQPQPMFLGPRFGVVTGDNPTFEDLPEGWDALYDIQVDERGDAVVLQKGVVYRHLAGGWEEVPMPCGLTPSQLVIDGANALWFVLDQNSTLYRRAADGSWSKTATPGGDLIVAGGTVHLHGSEGVAHRAGTAWSQAVLPPARLRVAVDSCWAPHAVSSRSDGQSDGQYEIDYTRWTSRGFLTLRLLADDLQPDTRLAVTSGHVFVHGGGNIFVLPTR